MEIEYDLCSIGIMIGVISFLGFILENLWLSVTKGYIDNRNMGAPFLLGYGILVVGIYIILGIPSKTIIPGLSGKKIIPKMKIALYFIICIIIVSFAEMILGNIMEKMCGIEYWNYTWLPMHIGKYTSIPTSIGFAAIITLFMGNCFTPIMTSISNIAHETQQRMSFILIFVMTVDFVRSFKTMIKTHNLNIKWEISLHHT